MTTDRPHPKPTLQERRLDSARQRRKAGLCAQCSNAAEPHKSRCQECVDKAKAKRLGLKASGLCIYCGNDPAVDDRAHCEPCGAKRRGPKKHRCYVGGSRAIDFNVTDGTATNAQTIALCAACAPAFVDDYNLELMAAN